MIFTPKSFNEIFNEMNMNDIYPQKLLKQEELVEIIDTTGPGSLVFGEEHEVMDIAPNLT